MKETYIRPKMDVIKFDCEDVITTSGGVEDTTHISNPGSDEVADYELGF